MKQKYEVVWKILFLLVAAAVQTESLVGHGCTVEVAVATSCITSSTSSCSGTQCNDTLQAIINAINNLTLTGVTIQVEVHSACNVTDFDQCHLNASCSSVSESDYACTCNAGYHPLTNVRPGSVCLADPCEAGVDNCSAVGSKCIDTETSFRCECELPYRGDGYTCTKIVDECLQNYPPVCSEFANCTNDPSGVNHTCTCLDGYSGDGINCTNVDECNTAGHNCHANATCTDTAGSFTCKCNPGYVGDGVQSCTAATIVNCSGTDTAEFDSLEAWGENCNTVCLLPCNYTGMNYVTDGVCMDVSGSGSSASCVNGALVCDDTTDLTGQFTNDPVGLFKPVTVCTDSSIGIAVDRCGMNQVSYTLSNTYMGGIAVDAVLGVNQYSNVSACQGEVYFNVGRQYLYSASLYPSLGETCGTRVFALNATHFEFRNTLRGYLVIDAGPVIIPRHFQINIKCIYATTSALVSQQLDVLNLTRRDVEYDDSVIKTGYLEAGLWKDKSAETEVRMPVPYAENLFVSFRYVSESRRKPKIHIRRCWATPTENADSQKSRDVYRDRCLGDAIAGNAVKEHKNHGLLSFSTFTFGDNSDSIYVHCETQICSDEEHNCAECDENDDRKPPMLILQRIGPITVRNLCDTNFNGGCQHDCKLSEDKNVVCHCRYGYTVDVTDPTKCTDKSKYFTKFVSTDRKKHVMQLLLSDSYGFSVNAVIFPIAFVITAILIVIIIICSLYISSKWRKDFIMEAM